MAYRGSALTYKIRKTTSNNLTGDNYSITVPRVIAKKFEDMVFSFRTSGNALIFESGCKITVSEIEKEKKRKINIGGGVISF